MEEFWSEGVGLTYLNTNQAKPGIDARLSIPILYGRVETRHIIIS